MIATTDQEISTPPAPANRRLSLTVSKLITIAAVVTGGFIAFGLVMFTLSRHNSLYGLTEYDDGVYYGSAVRLIHGEWPYRDFVIVQPPGITVLMTPMAFLGHFIGDRNALAGARVLTGVLAGANAMLIAWLLRYRGRVAMAVAGISFGLFPPAFIADRSLELEPYLVFFCLLGAVALFQNGEFTTSKRRIIVAGLCFGIAGSIKSFAILAVIAVVVVMLVRRRTMLAWFIGAIAVGFAVMCGPFFIAAPHAFYHDIITSQITRNTLARATLPTRLSGLTGVADAIPTLRHFSTANDLPLEVGLWSVAIIVVGAVIPMAIRRGKSYEWFSLLAGIISVIAILVAASYYNHYAYFSEVFVATLFGLVATNFVQLVRRAVSPQRSVIRRVSLRASGAVMVLAVMASAGVLIANESSYAASVMDTDGDPGPAIAAYIPKGACAISDAASLLIAANRLSTGAPGCPTMLDSTGTWIAEDPMFPPLQCRCGPPEPKLTAEWKQWLSEANYAIFAGVHSFRIPWTPALYAWFDTHWERVPGSGLPVFERVTHRISPTNPAPLTLSMLATPTTVPTTSATPVPTTTPAATTTTSN